MALHSILVVEDQPPSREVLGELLSRAGYRVTLAEDGEEALLLMRRGLVPDAVVMDLHLPRMSGWQLRSAMLADARLAAVPVFVISAAVPATAPPPRIAGVFEKPLDVRTLLRVLARQLAGTREMPAA
jgi:CheY-like chemotaxis protein